MAERCLKVSIRGQVQGVSFRASTQIEAEKLGVTGYAKNNPDGSVEVLACGDDDSLEQLVRWLHKGPRLAKVSEVSVEECEKVDASEFVTR